MSKESLQRLRETIDECCSMNLIIKGRIYIGHGKTPPKGTVVRRGRYGGRYYETKSHSPSHALGEIGVARVKQNIDSHATKVKNYILTDLGETKDAYTKIRSIQNIFNDLKSYLSSESTQNKSLKQIRSDINDINNKHISKEYGTEWALPNLVDSDLRSTLEMYLDIKHSIARGGDISGRNDEGYSESSSKIRSRHMKSNPRLDEDFKSKVKHSKRYNRTGKFNELPMRGEEAVPKSIISMTNDPVRLLHDRDWWEHSAIRLKSAHKTRISPGRRKNNPRQLEKNIEDAKRRSIQESKSNKRMEQSGRVVELQNLLNKIKNIKKR